MNELQTFTSAAFGSVRIIDKGGQPWFVGKDVADIFCQLPKMGSWWQLRGSSTKAVFTLSSSPARCPKQRNSSAG